MRILVTIAALMTLLACHDLDTGEAPNAGADFPFTLTPLSATQIQVTWNPGSDDFRTPPELEYGIWFGADIDPTDGPNIRTCPGALSYTITGLDAETTYEVLVRVFDGGSYSTNENTQTTATEVAEGATYEPTAILDLGGDPLFVTSGNVFDSELEAVIAVDGARISFLTLSEGTFAEDSGGRITAPNAVIDVQSVRARDFNRDDLFVVTTSALLIYENQGNGYSNNPISEFEGAPINDSLRFTFDDGGLVDLVSYITLNGGFYIYQRDTEDEDDSRNYILRYARDFNTTDIIIPRLGDFDADGNIDFAYQRTNQLLIALGNDPESDGDFTFGSDSEITLFETFSYTENGQSIDLTFDRNNLDISMEVFNAGVNDTLDIVLFFRSDMGDMTQLFFYSGVGDGTFQDPNVTDYQQAKYGPIRFTNVNNDGTPDLLVLQSAANNIGVYLGSNTAAYALPKGFYAYPAPEDADGSDVNCSSNVSVTDAAAANLSTTGTEQFDLVFLKGSELSALQWRK